MFPFFWGPPPVATPTPPPTPPFVPTFEAHWLKNTASGESYPLNPNYFASEATAKEMMMRLGAQYVFTKAPGGSGGPFASDAQERWLHWADGLELNAGLLAAYFDRNSEVQSPGVAMNLAMHAIATARVGR